MQKENFVPANVEVIAFNKDNIVIAASEEDTEGAGVKGLRIGF